jgi:hypothetical protein
VSALPSFPQPRGRGLTTQWLSNSKFGEFQKSFPSSKQRMQWNRLALWSLNNGSQCWRTLSHPQSNSA